MRLATIRLDRGQAAARLDGDRFTVLSYPDVGALLLSEPTWREVVERATGPQVAAEDVDYAPLIPQPEKIFCIGLNYKMHAQEAKLEMPSHPVVFAKYWRSLIGANDDLELPHNSDEVDWEGELGLVVGQSVRHIPVESALDAVAGYTIINDVSMRDWQRRTSEFLQGKTFERSTPVGPLLVTPEEVDHARNLRLVCSVDDEVMQDAHTSDLGFSPAEIVAYLSEIVTLTPGDLIATGTPSGVGAARRPRVYLQDGQVLTTSIEGMGEQHNRCVALRKPLLADAR
jgi:acylpyruvate hydrolase